MSGHKKKAWFVTAFLIVAILTWALYAIHESAVAAAQAARANKSDSVAGCPFSTKSSETSAGSSTKKPCCHSNNSESAASIKPDFSRMREMANASEADREEFMKQFTPEQLAKCPHLNGSLKSKKSKK